ncbi:peptide ABC transporter substrate-binding protein [Candidatus Nanosynsacchari sp. TM7_ANC_38.39_G1_1]|uniref:peptide ABC transporter substrate-binding protein n=1 Tax=Candidatus Nanosynsacchari sp. TM7_ANC_38.39_G1_1 TaxID=1986206 RepID=UPI00101CE748|nr:peptide ABC transporter substrate-binding protein [Candidatus Nanosynsacchari sp. TM7_ANC_38.39_G1_1]RYC74338.1 Oligopeptide-binding protein AppA [Candidatus Nanosynsacchari sp. TM7_ANC_38.39_G1_1]
MSKASKGKLRLGYKRLALRVKHAEGATQRHASRFILRRIENVRLVMTEIMIWLAAIALLIAGLGIQYSWNSQGSKKDGAKSGGVYVEGVIGNISTLNPLLAASEPEQAVSRLLFSSLYNYDVTGALHTDLAESMTVKDDKVYTIKLRNAVWHDGKKLTAEDVVYTINLIKNPQVRSPLRVNWLDISARAIDDSTVEFMLPAVYAGFSHALTFPVIPKHILQSVSPSSMREADFSSNPVGSGPFAVKRVQTSESTSSTDVVRMEPNTKYYGAVSTLSRLELRAYGNESLLVKAVNSGEVSAASGLSLSAADNIKSKQYSTKHWLLNKGVYLLMNNRSQTLQDARVRRALRYATDTSSIRATVGDNVARLDTPILQSQIAQKLPAAPDYSLDKAKALLKEAGWTYNQGQWKGKDGRPLAVAVTTSSGRDEYKKIVDALKQQWSKLGVDVQLREIDTSSTTTSFVQSVLQPRDYDALLYELELGADPDVFAYWHSSQASASGYNFANYSNRTVDNDLVGGRSRTNSALRAAKYIQFVNQWLNDAPAIGLYQSVGSYVLNNGASIVEPRGSLNTMNDRYADVTTWSTGRASVYKTP